MAESEFLAKMGKLSPEQFAQVCLNIVRGMGFGHCDAVKISGMPVAFRETIIRRSTDEMYQTKEAWLLAFTRSDIQSVPQGLKTTIREAQATGIQNIFTVVFGKVSQKDVEDYHINAKKAGLRSILLTDAFAQLLALDYAFAPSEMVEKMAFSFAKLRERMKQQSQEVAWRKQFLSLSALPVRVAEVRRNDDDAQQPKDLQEILDITDLFGVLYKVDSFLLLGDPGGGKTTCLQNLAEELANSGGRTPVFLPLNRYEGNLLRDMGEALCGKADVLSEKFVEGLLSSGALTVILDGLNEIQSRTLQPKLIEEINRLTHPNAPTSRSGWIVSCRRYDFHNIPEQLRYLNEHLWDLQPLTSDLIYEFLKNGLGEKDGAAVYSDLGARMREICSNPLILNMVFAVYKADNTSPANRGILYYRFINLLLRRSASIPSYQNDMAALSRLLTTSLTLDDYCRLVFSVLSDLADEMQEQGITAVGSNEALDIFKDNPSLSSARDTDKVASSLSDSLLKRGILRYSSGKLSFFHHTVQEYFHAFKLKNEPLDKLIPSYGHIQGAKRESIIFLASLIDSTEELIALIERVLKVRLRGGGNVLLAYEIMQGAIVPVDRRTQLLVAKGIWDSAIGGLYVGANKRLATLLSNIAKQLEKPVEDLLREILPPRNEEEFTADLFRFYQEIGDRGGERRLLSLITPLATEDISENLLFRVGMTAYHLGQYQEAIAIYTEYISQYPEESGAYNTRALAYKAIRDWEKAEQDFKASLAISPKNVVIRTSYAMLFIEQGRKDEAIAELKKAVESPEQFSLPHFELGKLLITTDAAQALFHLEQASSLADDNAAKTECLRELLKLQEKLGRHAGAIISLKRLIDLNPTSWMINIWKEKFARTRLAYTEEQKRIPTMKAVEEGGEVALSDLAVATLSAAGWQIDYASTYWLRAVSDMPDRVTPLPTILLDVPGLDRTLVQERIHALQNEEKEIKNIVLLTTAATIEQEARIHLAQYPYPVTFITAVELREALLKDQQACFDLFAQALNRASERRNPFLYTNSIQESYEFFGRRDLIADFAHHIRHHELVALYGIHKIGKTSLLHQVLQYLTAYAREITSIWIEMSAAIKNPSDLYSKILRNVSGESEAYRGPISAEDFRRELYAFHKNKLPEHPRHRVLLILDEYPYLIPRKSGGKGITDYLEVLGLFKTLAQERWFHFLPCGRTSALSQVGGWPEGDNPLTGMIQGRFLEPLNGEETEELLKVLGQKAGLGFTEEAIARIFTLAAGHPFFTRTLGEWINKNAQKKRWSNPHMAVDPALVDEAVEAYLRSASDRALLSKIYREELELEEQRVVKILAVNNRPLPRLALFPDNAQRERRRSISQAIENLRATSVICEDEQGHFSHRYELLRRAIIKDMEDEGDDDPYSL